MSLLIALASFVMISAPADTPSLHCVKMGKAYTTAAETVDYKGIRYGTCCAGCAAAFIADPDTMLKADKEKGLVVGTDLFDPVSGARITPKADSPTSTHGSIVYYFANADEKTKFDADPKKFTKTPKKELLHCPVQDSAIKDYATAGGYVDFKGVRYYVCCGDCLGMMHKDAAKYTAKFADQATAPKPENQTK